MRAVRVLGERLRSGYSSPNTRPGKITFYEPDGKSRAHINRFSISKPVCLITATFPRVRPIRQDKELAVIAWAAVRGAWWCRFNPWKKKKRI